MKQTILTVNIAIVILIGANFYFASLTGNFTFAYASLVGLPIVLYTTIKTLKA
jgi:hypothetical protein